MATTGVKHTDHLRLHVDHYKGASAEYIAASYFLRSGMQVYWPAVQQSCVDFIVEDEMGLHKVQVKTAAWNTSSKSSPYKYLQCRIRPGNVDDATAYIAKNYYDTLVIVGDVDLWVIPAELITSSNICLGSDNDNYRPRNSTWESYKIEKGV